MLWRFRKHRLAVAGAIVIVGLYVVVAGAEFFAYAHPQVTSSERSYIPPQRIHFFDEGRFAPFIHGVERKRDPVTFRLEYTVNEDVKYRVRFFGPGFEYKFLGLIRTNTHLLSVEGRDAGDVLFLLGTDAQGRDQWSRLMLATRTSLTIGLAGVAVSLILGVVIGGISGYVGGTTDALIQRAIEVLRSMPTIPLWMGLAAALPTTWSVTQVYLAITVIISLIGWTELARVVRGKFLALRHEDFVLAAELIGCSRPRIIFRHMLPSFASHVIAVATLAVPAMIISETALSFLGLGLRPPALSWGVLLREAQNVQSLAIASWLLIPAVPVVFTVLAFNFFGDGLRDAADPYG